MYNFHFFSFSIYEALSTSLGISLRMSNVSNISHDHCNFNVYWKIFADVRICLWRSFLTLSWNSFPKAKVKIVLFKFQLWFSLPPTKFCKPFVCSFWVCSRSVKMYSLLVFQFIYRQRARSIYLYTWRALLFLSSRDNQCTDLFRPPLEIKWFVHTDIMRLQHTEDGTVSWLLLSLSDEKYVCPFLPANLVLILDFSLLVASMQVLTRLLNSTWTKCTLCIFSFFFLAWEFLFT